MSFPCELQRLFEQAIAACEYAAGEIINTSDLADQFEVTRSEMLLVLQAEDRKGLVKRQEGEVFEVLGLPHLGVDSVFVHTVKSGLKPSSDVRVVRLESATLPVAERLDLEVGAPVYRLERTRYVNREALANQINYMSYETCPGLEQDDVSHSSFQRLLEEKYFAIPTQVKEEIEVAVANEQDMEILNLPEDSPILVIQRIALSVTGYPMVWANIRIRPDRYQYVAELWPSAVDLLTPEG